MEGRYTLQGNGFVGYGFCKENKLEGKFAISPLFGVKVPLLPDDMVDPEKGTGLVMSCTFGDQTNILWWRKHELPTKVIFTKWGTIEGIEFDKTCVDIEKAIPLPSRFCCALFSDGPHQRMRKIGEWRKSLYNARSQRYSHCAKAERTLHLGLP